MRKLSVTPTKWETILSIVYLLMELLVVPSILLIVNMLLPKPLNDARLNLVFFTVNLLAVCLILRKFIGKALSATQPISLLGNALRGLMLYWSLSFVVSFVIVLIDPNFANINDASVADMIRADFLVSVIGTVILAPPCEELLFRGVIFGKLYNSRPIAAYAISALCFSLVHLVGYIGVYPFGTLALCFLQYLPAGIALGWAYVRSGSILTPIIMHTVVNVMGVALMR